MKSPGKRWRRSEMVKRVSWMVCLSPFYVQAESQVDGAAGVATRVPTGEPQGGQGSVSPIFAIQAKPIAVNPT